MKNYNSEQSSPKANFINSIFKEQQSLSHSQYSAIEINIDPIQQILQENKKALNLSSISILDSSVINKTFKITKAKWDKENKDQPLFNNKKIMKKSATLEFLADCPFKINNIVCPDQINLTVQDLDLKQINLETCQICHLTGQMIKICECQYLHRECLRKQQESLKLDISREDIKMQLFCKHCENYLQIHFETQFDISQCKAWRNFICSAVSTVIIISLISSLVYFVNQNSAYVYYTPLVFMMIILYCLILFISVVMLVIHLGTLLQKFTISIDEYSSTKERKNSNLQQIQLLDTLK